MPRGRIEVSMQVQVWVLARLRCTVPCKPHKERSTNPSHILLAVKSANKPATVLAVCKWNKASPQSWLMWTVVLK
eukprot:962513-Karenia_brevis.AAC.1